MTYASQHLQEAGQVIALLDPAPIEKMASLIADLADRGGRLFFLGVGGSAANCSHAVNDFRKIAGVEAYTPVDNVSELTARTCIVARARAGWSRSRGSVSLPWRSDHRRRPCA